MSGSHHHAGGPRRRSFTPSEKFAHRAAYEEACRDNQGGAYLRREGLYSSLITEWRRLLDAGVLEGTQPGRRVGRPTNDQAEIARLRQRLKVTERRLATTETALDLMGTAHELLEQISESSTTEPKPSKR